MDGFAVEEPGELLGDRRDESLDERFRIGFCRSVFQAGAQEQICDTISHVVSQVCVVVSYSPVPDQSLQPPRSITGRRTMSRPSSP